MTIATTQAQAIRMRRRCFFTGVNGFAGILVRLRRVSVGDRFALALVLVRVLGQGRGRGLLL